MRDAAMKDADGDDLELTPFGRHLVAIIGCAMFVFGGFLALLAGAVGVGPLAGQVVTP
jgi:hypothetical protein